ncbi:MAG: tRNA (N(6)-L-threonylcarbamoyladenosine(37)-C(2))-methylthiotransferase MtaB [Alphaproteobacteria bacterium]|nr:tRNA (N(6)-L-threonylcarbamoyladenosine(37)-C(2))-methylthiotransferase MtaB [Alphaproteobacteria bacterium]
MTIDVVTFGCRLNTYESEVMRQHAKTAGLKDTIIFNTCAVTKEAERQARQAIRRARRNNPNAKIIVTGCAAQVAPEKYSGMDEVNAVLGNEEKMHAQSYRFMPEPETVRVNDIMSVKETAEHMIGGFEGKARAFVQVQNGCDHRCTFCIIPFGRGNSRSVPIGEIVNQVRKLAQAGYKEVVLTGVDISAYGADLPGRPTLGQMTRRLLAQVPELPRLRISSIDAIEVDDDLFTLLAEEPRLMPHMHLSLQAGDNMILKRMKRRHSREDALTLIRRLREARPDMVLGADFIAGFPTETEEMFANTLKLVEEANITYLHVFPYSEREGTPAARMPQVEKSERKLRASRLRKLGEQQMQRFLNSQIGMQCNVLIEKEDMGRNEYFAGVSLAQNNFEIGSVITVKITGHDGHLLLGEHIQ